MQHEHLLQNAPSRFKVALQAEFLQNVVLAKSLPLLLIEILFSGTGSRDGFSVFLCLLAVLWPGASDDCGLRSVETSFPPGFLSDTTFRRCSIIFTLVKPVYFLSFPISAHRICKISWRLHDCSNSQAPCDHFDISYTSSLFFSTLNLLLFDWSSASPVTKMNEYVFQYIKSRRVELRKEKHRSLKNS